MAGLDLLDLLGLDEVGEVLGTERAAQRFARRQRRRRRRRATAPTNPIFDGGSSIAATEGTAPQQITRDLDLFQRAKQSGLIPSQSQSTLAMPSFGPSEVGPTLPPDLGDIYDPTSSSFDRESLRALRPAIADIVDVARRAAANDQAEDNSAEFSLERAIRSGVVGMAAGEDAANTGRQAVFGTNELGPADIALAVAGPAAGAAGALRAAPAAARGVSALANALRGSQAAGRAASTGASARAALATAARSRALATAGQGARMAGRGAVRTATLPFRHIKKTIAAPFAAQAPAFVGSGGDLSEFEKALEGTGAFASISADVAGAIGGPVPGLIGNTLEDAINLPAQVVPSLYLPGAAAVEGAQGDWSRGETLWEDFKDTSAIPALVSGDFGEAARRAEEHPLFTALEASGGYALAGRGAGALGRRGALGERGRELADTERAPLQMYGNRAAERNYSRNMGTAAIQRALERRTERRGGDPNAATPAQVSRYLSNATDHPFVFEGARTTAQGAVHRYMAEAEQLRRANRDQEMQAAYEMDPGVGANLSAEVAQGSIRTPQTFHADLQSRRAELQAVLDDRGPDAPTKQEKKSIQQTIAAIDEGLALAADDPQIGRIFEAADGYGKRIEGLQEKAIEMGLLDPDAAAMARYFPFAQRHMGARFDRADEAKARIEALDGEIEGLKTADDPAALEAALTERAAIARDNPEGLIAKDGKPLDVETIANLADEMLGGRQPSYLTHRPGWRGRGSFYQPFSAGRGRLPSKRRTGVAFQRGTYDDSYAAMGEQMIALRTAVDRAEAFDRVIEEFAVRQPNGNYWKSWDAAKAAADDPEGYLIETNGVKMVPIRIAPHKARGRELQAARREGTAKLPMRGTTDDGIRLSDPDAEDYMTQRQAQILEEALTPGTGKGDIALIPEEVANRLREHSATPKNFEKVFQSATSSFKNTVLPYSPKWMLGNLFEVEMRSLMSGLGLGFKGTTGGNRAVADRYLAEYEAQHGPEARARLEANVAPGQHYGSRQASEVFRSDAHRFGKAFNRLRNTPGPGHLVRAHQAYKDFIFNINGKLETNPQYAALGKQVRREINSRTKKWHSALNVSDDAIRDLVKGDIRTDRQIKYARAVEDVFGRWTANSPDARHFLTTYAPFYMWARSSTRFVFLTLPMKHPVKTGLLAAAHEMTDEEREKFGLDLFTNDRLPGFLQGGLPLDGVGILPTNRFSSFGVFADLPDLGAGQIVPQISGLAKALEGLAWTGDKLTNPDGSQLDTLERIGVGTYSQFEAWVPAMALTRRILEGGGTSEDTSTIFDPKTTPGTSDDTSIVRGIVEAFGFPTYDEQTTDFLRTLPQSRSINVPIEGADLPPSSGEDSSSSGYESIFSPGSSSSSGAGQYESIFK